MINLGRPLYRELDVEDITSDLRSLYDIEHKCVDVLLLSEIKDTFWVSNMIWQTGISND